ncbi:MAG: hypothetical protein Q8O56_17130 [Solirubrobacteraceae bacterium]|nr:hypothetical protein [Solirubrobacteraceae bacterium]
MPAALLPDVRDDLGRREFLAGALGAALLAGCGDDDDGAARDAGFPVTVDHSFGQTTLRSRPRRVASRRSTSTRPTCCS